MQVIGRFVVVILISDKLFCKCRPNAKLRKISCLSCFFLYTPVDQNSEMVSGLLSVREIETQHGYAVGKVLKDLWETK